MDFYNTHGFGKGSGGFPYEGLGPFALGQLHSYITDNVEGDNLILRSLMDKPAVSFGEQSVEKYKTLDNEIETLDKLLPDKSKSLKSLMGFIMAEIEERLELKEGILAKIDYDSLYIENNLLGMMEVWQPHSWGTNQNIERRRSTLEVQLIGLQKEKRMEYVACFRDLVFLKKDLMESMKEYWAAKGREDMLSGMEPAEIEKKTGGGKTDGNRGVV